MEHDSKIQIGLLNNNKKLHLQHGPIDLIIEAFGTQDQIAKAYHQAVVRFRQVLTELVAELSLLRLPVSSTPTNLTGTIAQHMHRAVCVHTNHFITPMAAVAGAVADEILAAMKMDTKLRKAYVNNGGDIALYLNPSFDEKFEVGVVTNSCTAKLMSKATISADQAVNGIATSGRHGRSHSLGIADSVTVFACNAAIADAAATIIANNIDLPGNKKIIRQPACELSPDSDLGNHQVTINVKTLSQTEISTALHNGIKVTEHLRHQNAIAAAFMSLQGQHIISGWQVPDGLPMTACHIPQNLRHARSNHA